MNNKEINELQAELWGQCIILAQGSDWARDSGETLPEWVVRRLKLLNEVERAVRNGRKK